PIAVESVTISNLPENNIVVIGQEDVKLTATVLPEDANTITSREWSSSNPDALEVSAEGVLTPKARAEKVEISYTVTYEIDGTSNTISDKVAIDVISPVTEIQGLPETFEMPLTTHRFDLKILPEDANNSDVKWTLSDDPENEEEENAALAGASIDEDGNLTVSEYGSFILTATAADGYGAKAECKVTVRPFAESITLSHETADIYVESTLKINAEITPENAVETTTITWTSSDEEVATVSAEGVITGVAEGTAVITASADGFNGNEIKAEVTVNVKTYPSETTTFPGFLTITTSEGETNTHETSVTVITTSDEHCTVKLPGFKIMGMPVEALTLEKIGYTVDAEGNETTPDSRSYQGSFENMSVLNGAVTFSGSLTGNNVGNELNLNATINVESWGETVEVVFAPNYEAPFTGAVNNTYLPGTLNVTLTDIDRDNETVTAEIPLTVNIATSVNSEGEVLPTCSIEIPAYSIGRYEFPEMKFDNVTVSGATTLMQFYSEFESFEVNDEIGSITGTLEGSMKGHEMAQFNLNFNFDYAHVSVQSTFTYGKIEDNIYKGTLTIDMGGSDITGGGQDAVVIITPSADGMFCTLTLPDFELTGIGKLGDIIVTDVRMTDDGIDRIVYQGQTMGMQLMGGAIEADVYLNGYSTYEGFATFDIIVVWNGINIRVRFNGELTNGPITSSVEVISAGNEAPVFYNLNGVRLNVESVSSLPAGIYIERCGNKTRKILVK
ncbi:MAG: Ig-like domain-containing protein, partial [Paramuribaculum sp.]|nr:Ig-like domain-containing protein [Paramuribaculum sp.]